MKELSNSGYVRARHPCEKRKGVAAFQENVRPTEAPADLDLTRFRRHSAYAAFVSLDSKCSGTS